MLNLFDEVGDLPGLLSDGPGGPVPIPVRPDQIHPIHTPAPEGTPSMGSRMGRLIGHIGDAVGAVVGGVGRGVGKGLEAYGDAIAGPDDPTASDAANAAGRRAAQLRAGLMMMSTIGNPDIGGFQAIGAGALGGQQAAEQTRAEFTKREALAALKKQLTAAIGPNGDVDLDALNSIFAQTVAAGDPLGVADKLAEVIKAVAGRGKDTSDQMFATGHGINPATGKDTQWAIDKKGNLHWLDSQFAPANGITPMTVVGPNGGPVSHGVDKNGIDQTTGKPAIPYYKPNEGNPFREDAHVMSVANAFRNETKDLVSRSDNLKQAISTINDANVQKNGGNVELAKVLYTSALVNFMQAADQKAQVRAMMVQYFHGHMPADWLGSLEKFAVTGVAGRWPVELLEGMAHHLQKTLLPQVRKRYDDVRQRYVKFAPEAAPLLEETSTLFGDAPTAGPKKVDLGKYGLGGKK